jgi:hypothetical protein
LPDFAVAITYKLAMYFGFSCAGSIDKQFAAAGESRKILRNFARTQNGTAGMNCAEGIGSIAIPKKREWW